MPPRRHIPDLGPEIHGTLSIKIWRAGQYPNGNPIADTYTGSIMADLHHLHEGRAVLRLPLKVDIRDGSGNANNADTVAVVGFENYPYKVVATLISRLGFQGQAETVVSLQKLPGWPPLPH